MGEQRDLLRSDRGATSIGDAVVSKIAGIAAQEVEKVQRWEVAPPPPLEASWGTLRAP